MRTQRPRRQDWGGFVDEHSLALVIASLIGIAAVTLYPFQFQAPQGPDGAVRLITGIVMDNLFELLANIVLFIPLGMGVSATITRIGKGNLVAMALAWLFATGLSLAIEWLQRFLPTRTPTFTDVATNSMGMLIGLILFSFWLDGMAAERRSWGMLHKGFGFIRYRLGRRHVYITRMMPLQRFDTVVELDQVVRGRLVTGRSGRTRISLRMESGVQVILRVPHAESWWQVLQHRLPAPGAE